MVKIRFVILSALGFCCALAPAVWSEEEPGSTPAPPAGPAVALPELPREWVDPDTGHRVIRLSREPFSSSLYFHQNAYTASGDKLLIVTPAGLATVNLQTREIEQIATGEAAHIVVAKTSRQVFYNQGDVVFATHLDTRATREVGKIPAGWHWGSGFSVNADETLLAGSLTQGSARYLPAVPGKTGNKKLAERFAAKEPMTLFTMNTTSGEVKTFHPTEVDWLNHVQFSPTDPKRIMFCHEGPWDLVDRIWTIRTDGTDVQKVHTRGMEKEIAGHEFFSGDGETIWYDLQTPKGKEFWLAGLVLATGEKIRYRVEREQWSVHYNISPDGKLFCGDGGGPSSVAAPGNGQWLYLFTPENGALKAEKLVNFAKHDYEYEPNATFTPDQKWLIFRSNMQGAPQVYAVELKKK